MAGTSSLIGLAHSNAYDTIAAGTVDSVLVPAQVGMKIRVHAYMINEGTTPSSVTFNSKGAGAGTAIWPALAYSASGGTNSPEVDSGWFETNRGEALTVTTGAGSPTPVGVVISLVPA